MSSISKIWTHAEKHGHKQKQSHGIITAVLCLEKECGAVQGWVKHRPPILQHKFEVIRIGFLSISMRSSLATQCMRGQACNIT